MSAYLRAIEDSVRAVPDSALGKLGKFVSRDRVLEHLTAELNAGNVLFVGGCIVLYDVGTPWWANTRVLFEELVIRDVTLRGVTVDLARVVDELKAEARFRRCGLVVFGDMLSGRAAEGYKRAGFTPSGESFTVEV